MGKKNEIVNYEKNIASLEEIVGKLEKGDLSLEESMQLFEKGTMLYADCTKMLDEAQARMDVLIESAGEIRRQPFKIETIQDNMFADMEEEAEEEE